MRMNRFYYISNLNFSLMNKYVNEFRVNSDKRTTLKWIRSIMAGYYLYIAYYGLFKLDFANISHPSWRNLQHHWWKCITVWNVVITYWIVKRFPHVPCLMYYQQCQKFYSTVFLALFFQGLQVRYFLMSFVIDHEENLPNREIVHKLVKFGKHVQDYCFITLDVPSSVVSVFRKFQIPI